MFSFSIFVSTFNRRVSLVEQELLTLPEHLSSPLGFYGVRFTRSFVLYVTFCRSLFVLFLLATVLSVFLWSRDSLLPLWYLQTLLLDLNNAKNKISDH